MTAPILIELGETVTLRILLVTAGSLFLWVVALALCGMVWAFVQVIAFPINQTIGKIPYAGDLSGALIHRAEQYTTNLLGSAANGVDVSAGKFWYGLRSLVSQVGQEIAGLAILTGYLAWYIAKHYNPAALLKRIAHGEKVVRITKTQVVHVTKVVTREGKLVASKAQAAVLPRIRAVEHTADVALPHAIDVLRGRTGALTHDLARLRKWVHQHERSLGIGALTGITALALSRLGASWTRCRNWKRIGREVCAANPNDITGLLSLFAAGAVLADYRELVKLAQQAERGVAEGLQEIAKLSGR